MEGKGLEGRRGNGKGWPQSRDPNDSPSIDVVS